MFRRKLCCTVLLLLNLFCAGSLYASTPSSSVESLRKSVLALDSAWNMALSDLQQKKRDSVLHDTEKKDYAKFITFLSTRINEYCYQIRTQGGEQAVADLPCPDESALSSGQEISFTPTKADQVAELDKSLSQALGEFDEQLLKEEQKIASRLPAERETGGGYGAAGNTGGNGAPGTGTYGGGGMSGSGGQTGTGGQGTSGSAGTGGMPGNQSTGPDSSGSSGSGQSSQSPAGGAGTGSGQAGTSTSQTGGQQEIESGYDDIVARQLREAAEKETDPELKEKLWEEYRKYKEGIR